MKTYLVLMVGLLAATTGGTGCLVGLPPYQSNITHHQIAGDQVQAIIPGYRFTCPGRITGWGGCFSPVDPDDRYHMVYQVWREAAPGCYHLVGPAPPSQPYSSDLLRLEDGCNTTTLPAWDQLQVEEGDVVGFYLDYWKTFTQFALVNINFREAGLQVVSERSDVEVFFTRGFTDDLSSSYSLGSSLEEVCDGGSSLQLVATGAPVITVMFEPAETQTRDPIPEMMTSVPDQQQQITTIVFSTPTSLHLSFTSTAISDKMAATSVGGGHSSVIQATPTGTISTSSPHQPDPLLQPTLSIFSTPPLPPPTPSQSPSLSLEPPPPDPTIAAVPDLLYDDNSSLPHIPYVHDRYTTLAIAASFLVLLNILLIAGALVLITLCLRRRYRRRSEEGDSPTISGPQMDPEPVMTRAGIPRASGESQPLSRQNEDTVSMISNLLYASSPARDPTTGVPNGGEGGGERRERGPQGKGRSRLAPDSMVYNGAYGGRVGKKLSSPQTSSNAAARHVLSSTDNDGYEYIEEYL